MIAPLDHPARFFQAKQKACTTNRIMRYMAQALGRRLRWNIHDTLRAAKLAFYRQIFDLCGRQQPQHCMLATGWTAEASLVCFNFTILQIVLQHFSPRFLGISLLLYTTPRLNLRYSILLFREQSHHMAESSITVYTFRLVGNKGTWRRQ